MKTLNYLCALGVAFAMLSGCDKEPQGGDEQKKSYSITAEKSDQYEVEVADSAIEGDEVAVKVTVNDGLDLKVVSVSFNDDACQFVSMDGNVYNYSFVMPAENVNISVELAATAFNVSWDDDNEDYAVSGLNPKAAPGDVIEFTVSVKNLIYAVSEVTYGDGLACEKVGDAEFEGGDPAKGPLNCKYKFTMPENDVNISVVLAESFHRIYRTSDENAAVKMLNLIKVGEDDKPAEDPEIEDENDRIICEGRFSDKAYFAVETVGSYKVDKVTVTGRTSGAEYETIYADDPEYGMSYSFTMNAEPVDIAVSVSENNVYEGKDFLGSYSAFWLKVKTSYTIYSDAAPTMNYELREDAKYTISSSDENKYSGMGIYTYDEAENTFTFDKDAMKADSETMNTTAGLTGTVSGDLIFVTVKDVETSAISLDRFYIAAKDVDGSAAISDYVAATDELGFNILMSFRLAGAEKYFLYEHLNAGSLSPVSVEYISGSSIDENGAYANVAKDGETIMKYRVNDNKPVFQFRGNEAGSYEGSAGTLVLDGFGEGSLGGNEGTYTLESGYVVFVDNNQTTTKLLVNYSDKTYTIDSGVWDGPMQFIGESDKGVDWEGLPADVTTMLLDLSSQNISNSPYISLQFDDTGAFFYEISYTYDSVNGTITVLFLDMWTGEPVELPQGDHPALKNLVFKASEDKQTLEIVGLDTLYGPYDDSYLPLDGFVLKAGEIM